MEALKVKFKKLSEKTVIPKYAKAGDAGLDLVATSVVEEYDIVTYGTGLAVEIPEGHVGLIYPRSSISKYELELTNSVGVIDSGYRGEITFKFRKTGTGITNNIYKVGDRIGQLIIMPYPKIETVESSDLSETERGTGGYGSTGK